MEIISRTVAGEGVLAIWRTSGINESTVHTIYLKKEHHTVMCTAMWACGWNYYWVCAELINVSGMGDVR